MRLILVVLSLSVSIASNAQSVEELTKLGYSNYESANYEQAVKYFDDAIKIDSGDPEIYYLRGVCKSQLNKNKEAILDYDLALKLDDTYAEVHYEKGYAYFLLGGSKEAIQSFSKAIELKPDYAAAWFNRGSVKCIAGDKEGAKEDWAQAEKLGSVIPNLEC